MRRYSRLRELIEFLLADLAFQQHLGERQRRPPERFGAIATDVGQARHDAGEILGCDARTEQSLRRLHHGCIVEWRPVREVLKFLEGRVCFGCIASQAQERVPVSLDLRGCGDARLDDGDGTRHKCSRGCHGNADANRRHAAAATNGRQRTGCAERTAGRSGHARVQAVQRAVDALERRRRLIIDDGIDAQVCNVRHGHLFRLARALRSRSCRTCAS